MGVVLGAFSQFKMFALLMTLLLIGNGSSDENLKKYPYLVGIGYIEADKEIHACTGTLLQENWVVTNGDCIEEERKYYVAIINAKNGHIDKNKKIIGRYFKDNFDFELGDSTLLGLIKIDHISTSTKTYPTPISNQLPLYDVQLVYLEYVNNTAKVVKFTSSPCFRNVIDIVYVCVKDARHVLSTKYGGPLLYNGTSLVGVYSADIINEDVKRFIAIKPYFRWINEQMGRKLIG